MYPVLFHIGPWPVYSYGFMLCVAFAAGTLLLRRELGRKGMEPALARPLLLLALVFGLLGSILFDAADRWVQDLRDPERPASAVGAACLGGFLCAFMAAFLYARKRRLPVLRLFDAAAPGLMLAYGIARIGCQLSGDGDYGTPTSLPWGMSYPHGTLPTLERVHPTPVYETLASFGLFAVIWRARRRDSLDGWLFSLYLVFSGTERFFIEFIRLNPKWFLDLSQAQLISLGFIVIGLIGIGRLWPRATSWRRTTTPTLLGSR